MKLKRLKKFLKKYKGPIAHFTAAVVTGGIAAKIYLHYELPLWPTIALLSLQTVYIYLNEWLSDHWY